MKVLVTGHKGYIGSVLVPMLLERGHDVTGLDSDLFAGCTYTGELARIPEHLGDVRDAPASVLAGKDAVIHLAGLSNDPLGDYDPSLTDDINHVAAVRMARLAKQAGVPRFLFASSCSTYGASGDQFLDETARFNPVTPYGESKVNVELSVMPLADETFSPTFLRASTAYGMSPRIRFDLVVNNLVAWAYTTGEVYLKSDGSPWRPIVHVEDISAAYIAALEAPRETVHRAAFNVGSTTENYQIRDIAEMVREVVPCGLIARTLHGFKPQWTARRGIEQLYETFQRVGLKLEDFEGERFKRIAHIKKLVDNGEIGTDLRRRSKLSNVG
jgi:nucleoside-diphosphate-sugar epimerase